MTLTLWPCGAEVQNRRRHDWETPRWLFDAMHARFSFDVDAASTHENALLGRHWTAAEDGLQQSWAGLSVWCNPPYGDQLQKWVTKAMTETTKAPASSPTTAALLVPVRAESWWWHNLVLKHAIEINFVRRRVHFLLGGRSAHNSRPVFASAVI